MDQNPPKKDDIICEQPLTSRGFSGIGKILKVDKINENYYTNLDCGDLI